MLRVLASIITVLLLFSCAPKKELIKTEEAPPPTEKLVLPEIVKAGPDIKEKRPEPVRIEEGKDEKYIILNFEGADIEIVIATFGELLEMNYILTPGITGKVTVQSYKKFPVKDLYKIFQTILEINGLTAVKDGAFYRIVPIDTAKMQPVEVESGKEFQMRLDEGFVTQIIPLEYVKASEIANTLRTLAPRGTDLIVYEPTNLLIVTALPHTLVRFMKIIEAIDISDADKESLKTFVYYVENGEAKKLAEILKTLYAEKKDTAVKTAPPQTFPQRPPTQMTVAAVTQIEALPGAIGEITVTAYEDINALIVQCSPRGYLALLDVLKKIDIPVKQVLIEVMIAEVTLTDKTQLGLEWLIKTSSGNIFGFNLGGVTTPPTLGTHPNTKFAAVVSGNIDSAMFNSLLGALSTTDKFNVLASPHILTVDNKEASIHVGEETPIATSTQQPSTGGQSTTIQYKTVGTILTVKPHITEKNRVTLELTQEVSQLGGSGTKIGVEEFPSFDTRKAKTTAVVQSGHTLLIGGLIRESKKQTRSGIPWLSKIPILGYLFGSTTDIKAKTELLIMVTPHVISNQEEADKLTRDFQNRVKTIKDTIIAVEKKKKAQEDKDKKEALTGTQSIKE